MRYEQSEGQSIVTSRSVPQQTAQIFSPLAGQKRAALRFSQIGQDTGVPSDAFATEKRIRCVSLKSQRGGMPEPLVPSCPSVGSAGIMEASPSGSSRSDALQSLHVGAILPMEDAGLAQLSGANAGGDDVLVRL